MLKVNIHEAKTHLSRLLLRVAAGEEVIISNAGRPVAKIVPLSVPGRERVLGRDKGQITIADDFDAQLPEDVIRLFES